jgi:hypothetical protein
VNHDNSDTDTDASVAFTSLGGDTKTMHRYGMESLSDIVVKLNSNIEYHVHSQILALHSGYFKAILEGDKESRAIELPADISFSERQMSLFFDVIYGKAAMMLTGSVGMIDSHMNKLLVGDNVLVKNAIYEIVGINKESHEFNGTRWDLQTYSVNKCEYQGLYSWFRSDGVVRYPDGIKEVTQAMRPYWSLQSNVISPAVQGKIDIHQLQKLYSISIYFDATKLLSECRIIMKSVFLRLISL